MHREGMAEARLRNAPVEHREIGRMEDAVAQPGERRGGDQPGQAAGEVQRDAGQHETADAGEEHAEGAETVDEEAGGSLADPGNHEEDRHRHADGSEVEAEIGHQPREQRRQ
ncbi:hypothetical protein SDC9_159484 [bioreactor metagenome]|uniref:Uncharacterized protein n=1 Tax=bioreactor metagenome TaxID=1076179 RepID=A0A645FFB4_9ZZZZ